MEVVGIFGPEALEESVWAPKKAKRFYLSVKGFAQKIPLQLHPYNYTSFIYIIGMEYMFWKVFNYTMPTSKKSSKAKSHFTSLSKGTNSSPMHLEG